VNDYLISTKHRVIKGLDVFKTLIQQYAGQLVPVWVYNSDSCEIRCVDLPFPSGGQKLGCEVGDGLLNRIPLPKKEVTMAFWKINPRKTNLDMVQTANSIVLPNAEPVTTTTAETESAPTETESLLHKIPKQDINSLSHQETNNHTQMNVPPHLQAPLNYKNNPQFYQTNNIDNFQPPHNPIIQTPNINPIPQQNLGP